MWKGWTVYVKTAREGRDGGSGQAVRETTARKRAQVEPESANVRRVSVRIAAAREEGTRRNMSHDGARDRARRNERAPANDGRACTSDTHHNRNQACGDERERPRTAPEGLAQEKHVRHQYALRKRKERTDTAATCGEEAPQSKHSRAMSIAQSGHGETGAGSSAQHASLGQLHQQQSSERKRTRVEADVETWHVGKREGSMTDHWRCKVFTEGGVLRPECGKK